MYCARALVEYAKNTNLIPDSRIKSLFIYYKEFEENKNSFRSCLPKYSLRMKHIGFPSCPSLHAIHIKGFLIRTMKEPINSPIPAYPPA